MVLAPQNALGLMASRSDLDAFLATVRHHLEPGVADFAFGNPQELPLPGLVDALQRHAEPKDKDWFAYKFSEANARDTVAATLRRRTGIDYDPDDIAMTAGAFGALGVAIRTLCDVGDEVILRPIRR